ncbi:Peptide chain release factor 1 [Candidatus Clavichlamydia salmonicola]|uniref:peptide chain release factor 1 n=1 Tax=Candidatus Clavichlamydia salmonicola TaxID=469812 RepID=UPI0018918F7E|nr:peptide chain release factor 1 [Candidatus Clavichlamydia salmonicola]MBF5050844.1 Peptide chain release factor 1 [Candidatus Clavichlamydia salmonicola]
MNKKIMLLMERLVEVEKLLALQGAFDDPTQYKALAKEHSFLSELKSVFDEYEKISKQHEDDVIDLKAERDVDLISYLEEEIAQLKEQEFILKGKLENLLVPVDPDDDKNIIMELRAGTGGDEAALFVGNCVRMYQLYAAARGWEYETLSANTSDLKGFRECIMVFSGPKVKRFLQYEGGTHRVQRVPETEAQGRVHTSAITVAVLPEPGEEEAIVIDEKELRIDTYRSSGAGGQHVNVTDSAVRITHLPTGVVVCCQDERSQHKNKDKAMRILKARVAEAERAKKHKQEAALRAQQVGSGDRSERIRTYNYSQNRITDHRINLTLYSLDRVMQGDLFVLTETLVSHFYNQKLTE